MHEFRSMQCSAPLRDEQEARARLEQLRVAVDEHAIVSIADIKGNIVHVNDRFCNISGYSRQELLGQNHRMIKSVTHPPEFFRGLWRTIGAGRTWHGEVCNRRKNGELYWVEATIVPSLDDNGTPNQYISIRTDITALKRSEEALRLSDERLRRSQVFANIGTWDWNIETGELFWSECIAPLFGYLTGQLETSYESFLNAVHPDDRQSLINAVNDCIERDVPYEIAHRVVWPDGTVRWLLEKGAVTRDATGRSLHMLGVVQDITDRVKAEARLRETEERFSFAVEGAGDGIWDWNILTGERLLSGHYEAMLGFGKGEIAPTLDAWVNSVHPDDLSRVQQNLQDYLAGTVPGYDVELRLRCQDGCYKWILCRGTVVARNDMGKAVRMIGIHSDITDRKTAELRLAERERLLSAILTATRQGFWFVDANGLTTDVNPAMCTMLARSREDFVGKPIFDFVDEENAGVFRRELERREQGIAIPYEVALSRPDGTKVFCLNTPSLLYGQGSVRAGTAGIFTDITELKNAHRELAALNVNLTLAREAADRANQAKSDFLSSMSHELRTPMNAIIGFAQMLECDADLNTDQKDNVEEILKASRHLLELINEVLDLAKIESGRIDLSLEPVDLAGLIQDCRNLIQPLAAARQIVLRLEVLPPTVVRADRVRLKQVLLNLLSNAVKYNREGGAIHLSVQPATGERLRIAVADTGTGIEPERMADLFQPFNRLDAEHSEIEGTGIGLTITRRLVELMGGEVGVDSQVGVGTTFWIALPTEAAMTPDAVTQAATAGPQPATPTRQHCVLCIDDNPMNLKLIAQMLSMRRQVNLVIAHTPELGIELALAHRPELILLDINMPGMDGYQVLEVFKADAHLKTIPVVAVTANAVPRDIERCRAAGFTEYLTKPIDVGQFLTIVDRRLASGKENAA